MKQMEVTIMGQSYILACPEGGETALLEAVGSVDREMCAIRDAGKVKARERIAVLSALNLAYALAERPAAARASSAVHGHPQSQKDGSEAGGSVDMAALVRRIDAVLGDSGQLL
jgi:cell division protein ZapA